MGNCNYNKKFRQSMNKINGVAEKKIRFTSSDNFIIIPKFDVSNEYFKVINKVQKMYIRGLLLIKSVILILMKQILKY